MITDKVGVEFYQRLFGIIGIQQNVCIGIARKFYLRTLYGDFHPDEKSFKNISMFEFGTMYCVPLAYRKRFAFLFMRLQL